MLKSKEVSKAILKETMKGMLYIAKNNGITTNEMLTNDQTVEYCKKGGINVLKNIIWGGITCNTKLGRAVDLAELDMGIIMKDVVVQIANPLKKPYAFVCTTEEIIFSVRNEDFANCLIGVNNLLEK